MLTSWPQDDEAYDEINTTQISADAETMNLALSHLALTIDIQRISPAAYIHPSQIHVG